MTDGYVSLIPGWAKVKGDGGPHINRSVEAEAMLVRGDSFFSKCCRIASPIFCARSAAQNMTAAGSGTGVPPA
jgi:hypothetical protein